MRNSGPPYGVGEVSAAGDSVALGDGDSSVFFVSDFFFFDDSDGEADSSAVAAAFSFFLLVVFLVVPACVVVAAPVEVAVVSSFLVMQEVTKATVAKVVIKNKMGFFIGLGLAAPRMLSPAPDGKY